MSAGLGEVATAVALFAGTNIDDVVVLALLSAASRSGGRPRRWQIWAGQYAGFAPADRGITGGRPRAWR